MGESASEKLEYINRYKDEIKPILGKEEADVLDHLNETGTVNEKAIDAILEKQETKMYSWERSDASPEAKKVLLVARDPGSAIAIQGLMKEMHSDERIGAIGLLVDGVAQRHLDAQLKNFQQLSDGDLIIPNIIRSAEKPYDVVISTISATNNPASLTLLNRDILTSGREGSKSYFISEAYEWGVQQKYYDEVEHLDGVFCNDELAKAIIHERFPEYDIEKIHPTGTAQSDNLKLDQAASLWRAGREKMDIRKDTFVLLYLGTVSGAYQTQGLDSEVNEKSWSRTVNSMAALAKENPQQTFVLLYRPHPRDPNREALFDQNAEHTIPENLQLKKATDDAGITVDMAMYASNAIASITLTENFKAQYRKRQGIYLGFDDPGMGMEYLRKNYSSKVIDAMRSEGKIEITRSDAELTELLRSLKDTPLINPGASEEASSSKKILDVIFADLTNSYSRSR